MARTAAAARGALPPAGAGAGGEAPGGAADACRPVTTRGSGAGAPGTCADVNDEISVVCPLHDRIYDLRTGAGIGTDCSITTYPVRLDADGMIRLVPDPQPATT